MSKDLLFKFGMTIYMSFIFTFNVSSQLDVNYVKLSDGQLYGPNSIRRLEKIKESDSKSINVKIYPDVKFQTMKGIGGAFNEQGGEAYMKLSQDKKNELVNALFSVENGAGLTFCRTSIGASDFGLNAYSYSETPEDYSMENFSIERDKKSVIPFIQDGIKVNSQLTLFASPWSPPGWMKESGRMDLGREMMEKNFLKDEEQIYKAYALYMLKFIESYEREGIKIERILIQNEQDFHTIYPSCCFPVEQMFKYVDNYLLPLFKKEDCKTEIWAGTFRAAGELEFLKFASRTKERGSFAGMGIQYTNPKYITEIYQLFPNVKLMHTEGVCYKGQNSIEQALNRFDEVSNYINGGCSNFCYWNMVLNENETSAWGWKQNSLVTVNRNTNEIIYHPDYAVFLLLSKYIRPGMIRVASITSGNAMAFIDNNKLYIFVQNRNKKPQKYNFDYCTGTESVILPAESLCSICIDYQ